VKRVSTLSLLVLCVACGGEEGRLDQPALGITASKDGAYEGPVGCEKLPLLRGSRAISRYVIDERFDMVLDSTPERAHVSFVKGDMPLAAAFVILRVDLHPDFLREVTVPVDASMYTVKMVSGCAE
jgi:hypothetical protein